MSDLVSEAMIPMDQEAFSVLASDFEAEEMTV
jgi:hypothetical protein